MKIGQAIDPGLSHVKAVRDAVAMYGGQIPKKLPEWHRGFVALCMARQYEHMKRLEAAGTFGLHFHGHEMMVEDPDIIAAAKEALVKAGKTEEAKKLGETTGSASVAAFTVQQLAVVEQIYERSLLPLFASIRVQNQPRAFVHTWKEKAGDAAGTFAAGDLFNSKLDPDYTKIAAEGNTSKSADFEMASATVTAVEDAIHAEWHLNAQQDMASQYGLSLPQRARQFLALELNRNVESRSLTALTDNAANTAIWAKTAPAGTVYETLDPDKWRSTLFRALTGLDNDCLKNVESHRGTERLFGDPDSIQLLEDLNPMMLQLIGQASRATAGDAQTDLCMHDGKMIGRWESHKVRFGAANTMVIAPDPMAPDQEICHIHSVYVPVTDLGLFLELKTRKVTISAHTRSADVTIRGGMAGKLEIGA